MESSGAAQPHLAYLELYTPFKDKAKENSELFSVSHSFVGGQRKVAVTPVWKIFRSCHLLPRCRPRIDKQWESSTVLDQCSNMFLNTFSDHHMYLFVD